MKKIKSFEPYSREKSDIDQVWYKIYSAEWGWQYFHKWPAPKPGWEPVTRAEYDRGVMEYLRAKKIEAQGIPTFNTPEEAEAWLDAQS